MHVHVSVVCMVPLILFSGISISFIGLIFLNGVTVKRVYKNWLLDVMETAMYFNLVAFSALM